ncbi:MAG: NlpC/P60 family protein [Ilumatobacteraceae bacterium]
MPTSSPFPIRPASRLRARLLGGVVAAIAAGCLVAAPAGAAPMPTRISGDHHSPTVVALATVALADHDVFSVTGSPANFATYVNDRNATADAVAVEMGLDPAALRDAWSRADLTHQEALLAALTQLGVAYRSSTSNPGVSFDCSGLTAFAWGRAGVTLSRQSGSQINEIARRDHESALAGDIMQYPGHVMLYLGVGEAIVHASNPSTDVELSFTSRSVKYGNPLG